MKNKLIFFLIVFSAYGVVAGYGAEPSADLKPAPLSNQLAESVSKTLELQTKLEQTRVILSEIRDLLKEEEKILAGIRKLKEQPGSPEQARLQDEIGKERKALAEIEDQVKKNETAHREAGNRILALKKQLNTLQKTAHLSSQKENNIKPLQVRLETARRQRADAEEHLKKTEEELKTRAGPIAELTNMIAAAASQTEKDRETAKTIAMLTDELKKETALANELAARIDKQSRALKTLEDEKSRLTERLILAKENLSQEEKNINKLDEIKLQIAEQQKSRLAMEARLQQLIQNQDILAKEKKQLNDALAATGSLILENEKKLKEDGKPAEELQKEKELARKSADLLREKEESVKQLADKKAQLRSNLKEAETKLTRQNEQHFEEQSRIESELEGERLALRETEEKIKEQNKTHRETEKTVTEMRERLKALAKTARLDSQKENDVKRLQVRLATAHRQRAEAEEQLKKTEEELKARAGPIAELTNMIAAAESQAEKDRETAKTIAMLADELKKETALANELATCIDKQSRALKTLEDEKSRLTERLILAKENLGREEKNINKLDEIKLQIAEQQKSRATMETRRQQLIRDRDILANEKKQLSQALIEAGDLILKNEKDFQKSARTDEELQKEKELARKSADLLREKEDSLKQLAGEKTALQNRLKEAEINLAQQTEQMRSLEGKRRALDEEKKARAVSDEKYSELAKKEKEHKEQIKELKNQVSAATKRSESLSSQAEVKSLSVSPARTDESREAANMTESSAQDPLAVEQNILDKARTGSVQPSGQDTGTGRPQEQKVVIKTESRSQQSRLAQAEEHYTLGIQKWDENDLDGAVAEFRKVIRLNPDAAGAYYNISLAYLRQGKKEKACDYAYQAGECYIRNRNPAQAARMAVLLTNIDQKSSLIPKLREKIADVTR